MSNMLKDALCKTLGLSVGLENYTALMKSNTMTKTEVELAAEFEYKNSVHNCGMSTSRPSDVILFGFVWDDTPQGVEFWDAAHSRALDKERTK